MGQNGQSGRNADLALARSRRIADNSQRMLAGLDMLADLYIETN